jgi:hypothetical protein
MHLKAAAQGLGVDSGTLGWSILEKLVVDIEISEEWTEVWNVITTAKVSYNFYQALTNSSSVSTGDVAAAIRISLHT